MAQITRKYPIVVDGKHITRCTVVDGGKTVQVYFLDESGKRFNSLRELLSL
jgi:uncharacterized protein YigE (DUF2233 family)